MLFFEDILNDDAADFIEANHRHGEQTLRDHIRRRRNHSCCDEGEENDEFLFLRQHC